MNSFKKKKEWKRKQYSSTQLPLYFLKENDFQGYNSYWENEL